MCDEAAFLGAIQDDPRDDATRLVYADWLEDQGDIRAEYLRLEHQLERIPARLAELRGQIDPDWLERVSRPRRLVLVSYPPERKISVIKLVREITGLGLAEGKNLVDRAPSVIKDGLDIREARALAERFSDHLANVEVAISPTSKRSRRLVVLSYAPQQKIHVIKLVREITGLGLSAAKALAETPGSTIADGLSVEDADRLVSRFAGIAAAASRVSIY